MHRDLRDLELQDSRSVAGPEDWGYGNLHRLVQQENERTYLELRDRVRKATCPDPTAQAAATTASGHAHAGSTCTTTHAANKPAVPSDPSKSTTSTD